MNLKFAAPCIFGLEGFCANELRFLGVQNVAAENGRVTFTGDFSTLALANINSRYAERITILIAEFTARTFDELFEGARAAHWENFIGKFNAFPVTGSCLSSKLMSVPDCQKIIKKAVASRLSQKYMLPWLDETGAVCQIRFLILRDRVSIMLDASGAGLHKRGYRAEANEAPIKETLAAAMAEVSRVRQNHIVADPMCGSGTILIESALKALNIAPGLKRSFVCESWGCVPQKIFDEQRQAARAKIRTDCAFFAYGGDIGEKALQVARHNAELAGVAEHIAFERRDINNFDFAAERETVITNPPYGERLLDVGLAEELYAVMGKKFIPETGKSYTVISPDDDFEKIFGRKAAKRRKVYNGSLQCRIYSYFNEKPQSRATNM